MMADDNGSGDVVQPSQAQPLTLTLREPIVVSPKMTIGSLTFREPLAKDYREMPYSAGKRLGDLFMLAAKMTGQLPVIVQKLSRDDAADVLRIVGDAIEQAVIEAGPADAVRFDVTKPHLITLRYPIAIKGGTEMLDTITLRPPVTKDFMAMPVGNETIGDLLDMGALLGGQPTEVLDHLAPSDALGVVAAVRNFIDAFLGTTGATP